MRIAFYAPLKPPDHPVPSGDRLLARTFVAALRHAGHDVSLASRLRSRDGSGDSLRQQRIRDVGVRLAARLVRRWRREPSRAPHLWFSYHVYHKAPDWIGPTVSAALRIPYVVAEASIARKQRDGRWKLHPIADWSDRDVWQYLQQHDLPYHPLWHQGYVSIGDVHTTRPLEAGMNEEDTRFFGLKRECGLHFDSEPNAA